MTDAERLLDLVLEYQQSKDARSYEWSERPGAPAGREPSEIATEYVSVLKRTVGQ